MSESDSNFELELEVCGFPDISDNESPNVGFFEQQFNLLRNKAKENTKRKSPDLYSLIVDRINLQAKFETWDNKMWGCVEGILENGTCGTDVATKALLFMVVSLTENYKVPVGIFFINNPDSADVADVIRKCLIKLHEIEIKVISFTSDPTCSYKGNLLAKQLGAEHIHFFPHPSDQSSVYIIYDICALTNMLGKHWSLLQLYVNSTYELIDYSLIKRVRRIHEDTFKKRNQEIYYEWAIIRKRLDYDKDDFSRTVINALVYLSQLGYKDFLGCEATITFIKVLQALNNISSKEDPSFYEKCDSLLRNPNHWKPFYTKLINYLQTIKTTELNETMFQLHTSSITLSLRSLLSISQEHVLDGTLDYIHPAWFSLRHTRSIFEKKNNSNDDEKEAMTAFQFYTEVSKLFNNFLQIT